MLREERAAGTELGQRAAEFTERGLLAPDELIMGVIAHWLARQEDGYVFDGFPRTVGQADGLGNLLRSRGTSLDAVISLDAPVDVLAERVDRRLVCSRCGCIVAIGIEVQNATEPCPRCGGTLTHRADDTRETLRQRMQQYSEKSEPLISYYAARDILHRIDATRAPDTVFGDIARIIETE
jgi:adenylate kinase